jgi:hypothetical protein
VAADFVAGLPADFVGVMEASSTTPFVALTVRSLFDSRNDLLFTTFLVADLTRPAPSPVIFPHIADGAGFQTELILIQPTGAASMTVRYLDDNGQALNVAQSPEKRGLGSSQFIANHPLPVLAGASKKVMKTPAGQNRTSRRLSVVEAAVTASANCQTPDLQLTGARRKKRQILA